MSSVADFKKIDQVDISPGLLSLLPLFYVGWADSVLSPSEMKLIHKEVSKMDFISAREQKIIKNWTDPTAPPTEEVFKSWINTIKQIAVNLSESEKSGLVQLGISMAVKYSKRGEEALFKSEKTKASLIALSKSLGIDNPESESIILRKIGQTTSDIDPPQRFKPEELQKVIDGRMVEVKNNIRTLLKDPVFDFEIIRDKDVQRKKVLKQVKLLADQGLGSVFFSKAYGGENDIIKYTAIFEMLALYDMSLLIKYGVQFGLFGGAVYNLGSKEIHDKYLKDIGELKIAGCFAMTETGHGSNVRDLETIAEFLPETDEIIVHSSTPEATKEYIGNALDAKMATVFAQLIVNGENKGVHSILVPLRDDNHQLLPGIQVWDNGYKMGLNGVDNGKIRFDQVRVPRENLLNRFGAINSSGEYVSSISNPSKRFFTMLGALVAGRICVGLAGISGARKALTIAIRYGLKRRQFAPSAGVSETLLMDYPTHQHRLLPRLAKTYAYGFALKECTNRYAKAMEEGTELRYIETIAAGLKSMATWHANDTIQTCREACGGKGYLTENAFADLKADVDIFTTFEGDNTVLLQLVAKGLMSDFKQEFHEDGYRAVMRFLANRFSTTITELNPIITRRTDVSHLKDPDFYLNALQYRQKRLLVTVGQRMQDYLKKRVNPHDAFLRCQTHMVELGKAFTQKWALKRFLEQVDKASDPNTKKALKNMCDLYALSVIQENKGWYLEQDYLQGAKTKAIRRVVNKICQEIRMDARAYVDAFGIPDELLNAEIIRERWSDGGMKEWRDGGME